MNLAQNVCLDEFKSVPNWVTWGQKLGHQAKSAENLVNTSGHIFEAIFMNLAQNVYLDDF